mmetsp:Transcript_1618/g.6375  ORF Transcript_1618/g.6375 Transcript_1618/m.6375 type:complete len:201 (-) Transcript_1618:481-1083(-)
MGESRGGIDVYCSSKLLVHRRPSSDCTSGLKGEGTRRSSSARQLMPLKKAWRRSSAAPSLAPSRLAGSFASSPLSSECACELRNAGSLSFDDTMAFCRCALLLALNGTSLVSISQMMTPSDHQSAALPWPLAVRISGAMYSTVPTIELVSRVESPIVRASPKSVSLMCPSTSSRMFSGLRSRWAMPCECRCSSASTSSAA